MISKLPRTLEVVAALAALLCFEVAPAPAPAQAQLAVRGFTYNTATSAYNSPFVVIVMLPWPSTYPAVHLLRKS